MERCIEPKLGKNIAAYELQLLTEEESMHFELHLMRCNHCLNQVQVFHEKATTLRESTRARKLVARLISPNQGRLSGITSLWRYLWPDSPIVRKPGLAWLLIVLLALPAYNGLREFTSVEEVRPVQMIYLVANRSASRNVIHMSSGDDAGISFTIPNSRDDSIYSVYVEDEDGNDMVRYDRFDRFDEYGRGVLIIPRNMMRPGQYHLIIVSRTVDSADSRYDFKFKIEK